jgi:hypothetical protein
MITVFTRAHWSQVNPVHDISSYFVKTHFNIICPSASRSSKNLFSSHYLIKSLNIFSLFYDKSYPFRPSHLPCFDNPNNIWLGVKFMDVLFMQYSQNSYYLLPFMFKYYPQNFCSAFCQTSIPSYTFGFILQIQIRGSV